MKGRLLFAACTLAVVCILLSVAGPALADSPRGQIRTGAATIGLNDHSVIGEFTTDRDQAYTPVLSYTVFIIGDNGPIYYDVLLMDEANYTKYNSNEPFGYISGGSNISISAQSVSVNNLPLAPHMHYFLVVDNSNQPVGGSIPTQDLRIGYVLTGYNMSIESAVAHPVVAILLAMGFTALIVLVLVLIYLLVRSKRSAPHPSYVSPPPVPVVNAATAQGNCPVCGKPVEPGFMLCPNCGNRLK